MKANARLGDIVVNMRIIDIESDIIRHILKIGCTGQLK
jgi:hypothetical protein